MLKRIPIILLFILLWGSLSFAQTIYDASTTTTYAWDCDATTTSSEIVLIRDVSGEQFKFLSTISQITIAPNQLDSAGKRLKSGVYELQVKCVNGNGASIICSSLNSGCSKLKTGTAGTWKSRYKPAGPGGPIVVY